MGNHSLLTQYAAHRHRDQHSCTHMLGLDKVLNTACFGTTQVTVLHLVLPWQCRGGELHWGISCDAPD